MNALCSVLPVDEGVKCRGRQRLIQSALEPHANTVRRSAHSTQGTTGHSGDNTARAAKGAPAAAMSIASDIFCPPAACHRLATGRSTAVGLIT